MCHRSPPTTESTRTCIGKTQHGDLTADKGLNSLSHHNLVHTPISTLEAGCQILSRQRVGKARTIATMASDESQEQKKRSSKRQQKREGWTQPTSETRSWSRSSKSTKVASSSEVMLWKTTLGFLSVTNNGRRSSGCQTTGMRCTSKRRSISKHPRQKMEDAPTLLKLPKSERPDTWIRLPRHKWPQAWHSIEEPVVLVERHLCGHSPCWIATGDSSKKFFQKMDGTR